jgi:dihydrofolate reductase
MRRIVMFNRITLEGYFAGADGSWQSLTVPDPALDEEASKGPEIDTILLGRRTYQILEPFWSHALDNPNLTPAMRDMAIALNQNTKLVFSKTLKEARWVNSHILREFDPDEIHNLKRGPGKDIIVLGSGSIVSQLTQHGLIDEYQFIVSPLLLGSGLPLLSGVTRGMPLQLREAKAYPSGNVMLRYGRRAEATPLREDPRTQGSQAPADRASKSDSTKSKARTPA